MPLFLLAQDGAAAPNPPDASPFGFLPFMVLILAVWWFLLIRPQRKAEKQRRAKLDAIQRGDKVRTRGGIEGVVARVQDDKVVVKIDAEGKVHVTFAKPYIEDVLTDAPAAEAK